MKSNFQIKLSEKQERRALEDYEKYVREEMSPMWAEEDVYSDDEIEEDKLSLRQRFRLLAYHQACLSRIYKILKKNYGEEFARFASKIDEFGDSEAAEKVTKLVMKLEQMSSQGATKEAVQAVLNPFSSEYKLKMLEVANQQLKIAQAKAEEETKKRQETEAELQANKAIMALYRKQLEELQALKVREQQGATSKPVTFSLDNAQARSDNLQDKLYSLNTAYNLLQDNGGQSAESPKSSKTTPSP